MKSCHKTSSSFAYQHTPYVSYKSGFGFLSYRCSISLSSCLSPFLPVCVSVCFLLTMNNYEKIYFCHSMKYEQHVQIMRIWRLWVKLKTAYNFTCSDGKLFVLLNKVFNSYSSNLAKSQKLMKKLCYFSDSVWQINHILIIFPNRVTNKIELKFNWINRTIKMCANPKYRCSTSSKNWTKSTKLS